MAIDYGTRRVGIAVTDPQQIIASPVTTIDPKDLSSFLKAYSENEEVEQVVMGFPLKEDGSPTDLTETVDRIIGYLKAEFPQINFIKHDERYTSKLARQSMVKGGFKKKTRRQKSKLDQISATLILQSYMEERNVGK